MEILQPKLRFPEFDGNWKKKKLGEVSTNKSAKYNPLKENAYIKCIELEHLSSDSGQLLGYIDGSNSGSIKNKFEKGDVLFGKLRPYLKKYLLAPFEGACTSEIWVLKGIKISNPFLYRIVQTEKFIDIANQSSGSKMPRADWDVVSNYEISIPSLQEQTKIANFLSLVDEKLNLLKEKKETLEAYKKGIMQKIFNQEIRFKDDNGNDFEDWEEKSLGDISKIVTGKTPSTKDADLWNGDIQFITPTDIKEGSKYQYSTSRYVINNDKIKILPINSIVYTCIASIGKMCISKFPSITNQQINSLIINDENNFEYVYYWLLYITPFIKTTQANTTLPIINKTDFSNFSIMIPSLKEQAKIANFLSAIDQKIELVNTQIADTQEYKKGLLQQMFV